jgi:hypothetical protein
MSTVPQLRKKTPQERGPIAPDSLTAALHWDKVAPDESIGDSLKSDEADADLRRWRDKALKAHRRGDSPAVRFDSEYIPAEQGQAIAEALKAATNSEEVRAAFEVPPFSADAVKAEPPRLTPTEQALYDRLAPLFAQYGKRALRAMMTGGAIDLAKLPEELRAALVPAITEAVLERATALAGEIGPDFDPAPFSTAASQWARAYAGDLVQGIDETTRRVVQDATTRYQSTPGMTREELEGLLRPAFGGRRAEAIAVTEVTRAASRGTQQYQQEIAGAGIDMERVWRTSADEVTCPICVPLNGQPESEWAERYPDGPPGHVRCRCMVTLRLKKERADD